jgi:dihydropteroate synthase
MSPVDFESWLRSPARPPLVMGILNVTPDSFSDGGRFADPSAVADEAARMAADGADLIDLGGEIHPPRVAAGPGGRAGPAGGARVRAIVAQVPGGDGLGRHDPGRRRRRRLGRRGDGCERRRGRPRRRGLLPLVAARGAAVVLMHMQGTPATMQVDPRYADVTREVAAFLADRAAAAESAGVAPHRVLLDPGIGFGKTAAHNLALLRELSQVVSLGRPVLVGTSRKGFVGAITGVKDPASRVHGTAATVAWAVAQGGGGRPRPRRRAGRPDGADGAGDHEWIAGPTVACRGVVAGPRAGGYHSRARQRRPPMHDLNDIHPVAEFHRNTDEYVRRLKETGRPELLAVNGQAEIVVQRRGVPEAARCRRPGGTLRCDPARARAGEAGRGQADR